MNEIADVPSFGIVKLQQGIKYAVENGASGLLDMPNICCADTFIKLTVTESKMNNY